MEINLRELMRPAFGDYVDSPEFEAMMREEAERTNRIADEQEALHKLKMEYFQKAKSMTARGDPFHHLLKKSEQANLFRLKKSGVVEKVEVLGSDCCPTCAEVLHGSVYSLADAINSNPIPHPECTRFTPLDEYVQGWCICGFVYHPS